MTHVALPEHDHLGDWTHPLVLPDTHPNTLDSLAWTLDAAGFQWKLSSRTDPQGPRTYRASLHHSDWHNALRLHHQTGSTAVNALHAAVRHAHDMCAAQGHQGVVWMPTHAAPAAPSLQERARYLDTAGWDWKLVSRCLPDATRLYRATLFRTDWPEGMYLPKQRGHSAIEAFQSAEIEAAERLAALARLRSKATWRTYASEVRDRTAMAGDGARP